MSYNHSIGQTTKYSGCSYNNMNLPVDGHSGTYLVPNFGAYGYDALTHGRRGGSNCSPYFTQRDAYGPCGLVGEGSDYVCTTSQPGGGKCVEVQAGTMRPPGKSFPSKGDCVRQCHPGQRK